MIEDIVKLRIKGGIFEEKTDFSLFSKEKTNSKNKRISLIYGKNGSGKSTISRGFRKIKGYEEKQIDVSEILDENNSVLTVTDEVKNSIYVFNEKFIEDNIRIDGEGLNTIIVMGPIKDIDDKIKKIQPDYNKIFIEFNNQKEMFSKYLDYRNDLSPNYYINKMQMCLKGDNSWASRNAKINGNKINSIVKDDKYLEFIELNPSKNRDELIIEYDLMIKNLVDANIESKRIDTPVPIIEVFENKEFEIINLLKEKVEIPILSDREKKLFLILREDNGNQRLVKIKSYFSSELKTTCPFCFQNVDKEYAVDLVQNIEKILNKRVTEHQDKLKNEKLSTIEIDLSFFEELSPEKVEECKKNLDTLNNKIKQVNEFIDKKIENVYEPVLVDKFELNEKYIECNNSLLKLEEIRKEFNSKVTDKTQLIKKLKSINNDIAHYDIKDLHKKYNVQLKEKNNEENKLKDLELKYENLKNKIDKLEKEKKNANIAMKAINDDLTYIFFSKNRLRIEFENDKYVLYSRDKSVEPVNVSVGERNAIGLCYFFNHIMENKNEEDVYKDKYLIIMDDPVSSFDMENRIGILSYLKSKLSKYLRGNDNSKFLILTHDMQTFYDIRYFMLELLSSKYKCSESAASNYAKFLGLENKNITEIDVNKRSEYTTLLGIIFDYGVEIDKQYSITIGNIMRKVMEAFGTFMYKKGISQLSTDESIIIKLSKDDRSYYENLMYRLVLNTGSHMEEKVKTIDDMNFFDYISEEDKQRTARDIICFLYKLNPLHIKAHLKDKKNIEEVIKIWCEE